MADIDKEGLMNMLGSLIGDDKKESVDSLLSSIGTQSTGGASDNPQIINTAEMMSKMTKIMEKLGNTRDNREFALLSAMRPYMRNDRRSKVDTCLKMLQVVNVMKEMKKEG